MLESESSQSPPRGLKVLPKQAAEAAAATARRVWKDQKGNELEVVDNSATDNKPFFRSFQDHDFAFLEFLSGVSCFRCG